MLHDISVDDVIRALIDLFNRLDIDAPHLISRVKSLQHRSLSSNIYSHTAAIGELLTVWHQNPIYLDDSGNPLPIKMRGKGLSFCNLAKVAVPNMAPSMLLSELKRIGAVTVDNHKQIHARMRSVSVYEDKKLAIQHTLTSLKGFIATLRHNLDSDPTNSNQLFHRIAWNGAFDSKHVPALKIRLKRQGQLFLESFDKWMMHKSNLERKANSKGKKHSSQIYIGVYLAVDR